MIKIISLSIYFILLTMTVLPYQNCSSGFNLHDIDFKKASNAGQPVLKLQTLGSEVYIMPANPVDGSVAEYDFLASKEENAGYISVAKGVDKLNVKTLGTPFNGYVKMTTAFEYNGSLFTITSAALKVNIENAANNTLLTINTPNESEPKVIEFQVIVSEPDKVDSVSVMADGRLIRTERNAPYDFALDTTQHAGGIIQLVAEVKYLNGDVASVSKDLKINVANPGIPMTVLSSSMNELGEVLVSLDIPAEEDVNLQHIRMYLPGDFIYDDEEKTRPYNFKYNVVNTTEDVELIFISTDLDGNTKTMRHTVKAVVDDEVSEAPVNSEPRDSALVDFYADFDTHNLLDKFNCSGNCPEVIEDPMDTSGKIMKSQVFSYEGSLLNGETNYKRDEVRPKFGHSDMEYELTHWIGFRVFIHKDWKVPPGFEIITQIHQAEGGGQPSFAIYTGSGQWKVKTEGKGFSKDEVFFGNVLDDTNKWTDFVIKFRSSYNNTGEIVVWKNGKEVYRRVGRTSDNVTKPDYIKFGIYKGNKENTNILYHDDIRITSNPNATFKDVAP